MCGTAAPTGTSGAGFTLLEMLVVLALVALVAGIVGPVAANSVQAARDRGLRADLMAHLEALPVKAFAQGKTLTVDAAALARAIELPAGWTLQAEPALVYGPTGVATGGTVRLTTPAGAVTSWRIRAVSGLVSDAAAARP